MQITLLTTGKTDIPWVCRGMSVYISRLSHYINFSLVEIPGLKNVSSYSREQIIDREGELILERLRAQDDVILLDEHGREYSSVEFSGYIGDKLLHGARPAVFVVGGAYGFSDAVRKRANSVVSLSRMTFSHQMARVIFAEQLYRAFTILNGEPYHHE